MDSICTDIRDRLYSIFVGVRDRLNFIYTGVRDTIIQPPGVIFLRKVPPVEDFHQATYLTCLVRVVNQKHLLSYYE